MEMLELAHELGKKIADSEEMAKMRAAEEAQANDEASREALQAFNLKRMNLARDMQEGKLSHEEAVRQNSEAFDAMLAENNLIREFVEAKKAFDDMVGKINGVLNFYITGQDPDSCTHDCSTCGGCH